MTESEIQTILNEIDALKAKLQNMATSTATAISVGKEVEDLEGQTVHCSRCQELAREIERLKDELLHTSNARARDF